MTDGSIMDDMNEFFDKRGESQDAQNGVNVIRANNTSNNTNLQKFYQKLEELGINLDELGGILEEQSNMLVLSGAGSGKTTALILKIIRDLIAGDSVKVVTTSSIYGETQSVVPASILVSTFLKSGAEELKAAFNDWCRKLGIVGLDSTNIHFRTIHSEVKDALTQMGVPTPVLEGADSMLRNVMNNYGIRSHTSTSRSVTMDEVSDVQGIVAYARNRLDKERYEQPLMDDYGIDALLLDAILRDFKVMRMATGKIDFEDMQEILLEALQINENVRNFIAKRYDYVYVDEFQDTSQLQYEILKYYFSGAKRVIAIGDDDQTIYSWRGSDIDIIAHKFEEDIKPVVRTLSTNYRCRENILNFVLPSIEKNTNRHPKELKAHKEGGEVNVIMSGNVNMLVDSMKVDLAEGKKVGVLARVNADLLIPAIILELDGGIEFGISKSVSMSGRMAKQVFGIIDLVTKRITEEFEGYLRLFLQRYNWYEAEKLFQVLAVNNKVNLYTIPFEDIRTSVPNLAPFIQGLRKAKEMGGVEAYLYILGVLENQTFSGKGVYAEKARNLVRFVKRIVMEHRNVKDLNISQIDKLFNEVLPERLKRRSKYGREVFVKLSTVHEAKGKEWDSVYIWNNVNGVFPNKVGNREMTEAEYEEERRVHYIAVTRAKDKLTVYSEESNIGDFLRECDSSVVGVDVTRADQQTDMNRVFKRAVEPVSPTMQVDSILRKYISHVTEIGDMERVANVDIVVNNFQFEELVDRAENQYGIQLTTEAQEDLLATFFTNMADEIFNKGTYQA